MVLTRQHIMPYSMGNYAWVIPVDQRLNYFERTTAPCSPDLMLWGHISDNAYQNNPCNLDEVTTNISNITYDIAPKKAACNVYKHASPYSVMYEIW
jgi:hypothetical protein